MLSELADTLVWILRLTLLAGLTWGAWLCVSHDLPPGQPASPQIEQFATYAAVILLLTLGSVLHAV